VNDLKKYMFPSAALHRMPSYIVELVLQRGRHTSAVIAASCRRARGLGPLVGLSAPRDLAARPLSDAVVVASVEYMEKDASWLSRSRRCVWIVRKISVAV
jgi:hypothetical protein